MGIHLPYELKLRATLTPCSSAHVAILCSKTIAISWHLQNLPEFTVMPWQLLMSHLLHVLCTAVINPTDRLSVKWLASMQSNSHNMQFCSSSPPSFIIFATIPSMPELLPHFNSLMQSHSSSILQLMSTSKQADWSLE